MQLSQGFSQQFEQQMSSVQLQSLDILALTQDELYERIQSEAVQNPALEVQPVDSAPTPPARIDQYDTLSAYRQERTSSFSYDGEAERDRFNSFLENIPQEENQGIQTHLLSQLKLLPLDTETVYYAELIIQNLDANGFHCVPLRELFAAALDRPVQPSVVRKALRVVRTLDPPGCGVYTFRESLLVQAQLRFGSKAKPDTVFAYTIDLLKNHFPFLEKARAYSLAAAVNKDTGIPYRLTTGQAEEILSLIRSLEPFPGRLYASSGKNEYITPAAFIYYKDGEFIVRMNNFDMPIVRVSAEFQALARQREDEHVQEYAKEYVQKARIFIGSLNQREKTIVSVLKVIIAAQKTFFLTGDITRLHPLTQKTIADELGIHESTVSRAVSGNYVQCRWGLFEIRRFFSSAIGADSGTAVYSKTAVKAHIRQLLSESSRKLSDKQIAELLEEKYGIAIARRTVGKYRKELDIGSSYDRDTVS